MGKYEPLAVFLRRQRGTDVVLTFREIERIVGGILPKASARPEWWADGAQAVEPQKRAWTSAGFSPQVDFRGERVTFIRQSGAATTPT